MNIFVSYAFTGEHQPTLEKRLASLHDLLQHLNINHYINIYDPQYQSLVSRDATPDEYMHAALKELKKFDTVLVLNTSERRSEGSLMEIGAALVLGKKIIFAQHVSSVDKTYMPTIAQQTFVWSTEEDLLLGLKNLLKVGV